MCDCSSIHLQPSLLRFIGIVVTTVRRSSLEQWGEQLLPPTAARTRIGRSAGRNWPGEGAFWRCCTTLAMVEIDPGLHGGGAERALIRGSAGCGLTSSWVHGFRSRISVSAEAVFVTLLVIWSYAV